MLEKHVIEELENIVENDPVFPGDTISHATANECVSRGRATRNAEGDFIPTFEGRAILRRK